MSTMLPRMLAVALPIALFIAALFGLDALSGDVALAQPSQAASAYVILQSDAVTNTNGVAAAPITVADTFAELTVQAEGIVSATVNWEATIDGATWYGVPATRLTTGASATTATADGLYRLDVTGLGAVRARVSGLITNTTDAIDIAGYLTAP